MIKIALKFLVFSILLGVTTIAEASKPKYVFYFIGDGMGLGPVMAAQTYNRMVKGSESKLLMTTFPVASSAMTYSFSSPITDSAAAGTALSTGHKTKNGMLGMNPDTIPVTSIAKILHDNGYGVGIITSVPIDDATPGAFYAHVASRRQYDDIAGDLAKSGYNFFAGSVLRGKKGDVEEVVKAGGYNIYHGLDEYNASTKSGKTLILNPASVSETHIGYTIDSIEGALTLPKLTKAAIEHLEKDSPKKFFLMVEGGNIDWAAHANDPGAVVKEIINFDESLQYAYDFYLKHKDETLIIVTADHDTGGMATGQRYGDVPMANMDAQKVSKDKLMEKCKRMIKDNNIPTWEEMKDLLTEKTGLFANIKVTDKEAEELAKVYTEVFVNHDNKEYKTLYSSFNGFVNQVFALLNKKSNIGWTSTYHTGNLVPVFVTGIGADKFKSLNNNTDIPKNIKALIY